MDKPSEQRIYEFDDFRLDAGHLMLSRSGEEIPLAPKAIETLLALIERQGNIVSKEELFEAVWPETVVEESNLFTYIAHLRKTLGKKENGKDYIETLRRRGYRFNGNARLVEENDREHYAWVVDGSEDGGANIETQSGRIYVLKDWMDKIDRPAKPGASGATLPRKQLSEAGETASPVASEMVHVEPAYGSEKEPASREAGIAEQHRRVRKILRFWPFVAAAAVIAAIIAAPFIPRSFNLNEASIAKSDISITPLTSGVDVHSLTISRDGKFFAYISFDGEHNRMFVEQTGQHNPIEILPATKMVIGEIAFSPDGGHIYFSAREKHETQLSLYRIALFGGTPKKILTNISPYSTISFSPDGSEFVFARQHKETTEASIVVARTDGSNERKIFSGGSDGVAYPAWSPDRKRIAFARYFHFKEPKYRYVSIYSVGSDGQDVQWLLQERFDNCFRIAWTSRGDGLVFSGTKLGEFMTSRRDNVWHASLSSQKLTRISPEGVRYLFGGLTGDDMAIISTVARSSQIWAMDANGDSRTAVQLTRGTTDGRTGIAPLPDGRVGYMMRNGDNWEIWAMNADRSGQELVFNDLPIIDELRATPDGKYFVFNATRERKYDLFRINTNGSDLKQLTFGDDAVIGDSSPSSDSRSVVYTRRTTNDDGTDSLFLYRVSLDGGEPVPVAGAMPGAATPHFSPDGKYISYIDLSSQPARLAVLSTDKDLTVRFFDALDANLLNVGAVWTPDSKALAYIVYHDKASNIWLQPIDGGPPRQLTDFTGGRIYRIAYSADGKRIYLARGYSVNDALLVRGFVN